MLKNMDCILFSKQQADKSYDLIIADPPYNECIEAEWDNQWHNDEEYLKWLELRIQEFARLLKDDGNLIMYCKRPFLIISNSYSINISLSKGQLFGSENVIVMLQEEKLLPVATNQLFGIQKRINSYSIRKKQKFHHKII
jgi:DNA modification methylase